jgi:hypothetical protein
MKKNKKVHGQGYWEPHVLGWRQSGLSQSEYCRNHALSVHALRYWCLRIKQGEKPVLGKGLQVFKLPMPFEQPTASRGDSQADVTPLFVHIGRHRVEVGSDFNPFVLHKLLLALEGI